MRKDSDLILSLFDYEPESGKIICKPRYFDEPLTPRQKQWNSRFLGKEIGFLSEGYVRVSMPNGKSVYAHQIAFLAMTGRIPKEIDHRDLNKSNNKWSNLRESDHFQNMSNCTKRSTNKVRLKGVSWTKSNNCFRMDIQHKGVKHYSYHATEMEAHLEYVRMSEALHGEFGNAE